MKYITNIYLIPIIHYRVVPALFSLPSIRRFAHIDIHVDKCLHFCRGVPKLCGVRSSVYRHTVKGILMNFLHFGRVQLEFFNGVSERHHAIYWIYLCGVFRMCFCHLLDKKLFLYSYDIAKLLYTLSFTPFTTLMNFW